MERKIKQERTDVSIHFGQRWPKIRATACSSSRTRSFQSTSASAGRRYGEKRRLVERFGVSIHFGQRWPKIPNPVVKRLQPGPVSIHFGQRWPKIRWNYSDGCSTDRFNPLRPALAEDTAQAFRFGLPFCGFQSTSASAGRRYGGLMSLRGFCFCFNPLRPALAEDTLHLYLPAKSGAYHIPGA